MITRRYNNPNFYYKIIITNFLNSQSATTHGIYYAFERGVLPVSNAFWVATCLALFIVAVVLTVSAYLGWQRDPILTTVATTGLPVTKLDFPAITICGQGTIAETMGMALVEQMRDFYKARDRARIYP